MSNRTKNNSYDKYPFKFEFIRKGPKVVRIRYWYKEDLGIGRDVTREEAIWLYKKLIREGYKLTNKD